MSAFLTLDSISAWTPECRPLFHDLTLFLDAERVGSVGRNGSGKSTLLRIAAGLIEPSAGVVRRSGAVGALEQAWPGAWTLAEALGVADRLETLRRVLAGTGTPDDLDGADWSLEARIEAALLGAGLPALPLHRRMDALSGGERTRIGIARLVIEAPDLILLDEPTNNLDAAGRAAIRALVSDWGGGVLVASHDRGLLETMERIVDLTPIAVRSFGGGWSAFAAAREAERTRAAAELERAADAAREAQRAAQAQREAKARRYKAGRAFASKRSEPKILLDARAERAENAGGRARAVGERLIADASAAAEQARARVEVLTPLTIALPASGLPSGAEVLALHEVVAAVGDRRFGPWSLDITGPERVALAGRNGAGKTTLLNVAASPIAPVAGTVRRAEGRVAMLDQHVGLLDTADSILGNVRRLSSGLGEQEAYAVCALRVSQSRREAGGRHAVRRGAPAGGPGRDPRGLVAAVARHPG